MSCVLGALQIHNILLFQNVTVPTMYGRVYYILSIRDPNLNSLRIENQSMKRIPFTICFCHVVGSRVLQKTISKHRREVSLSGVEKWEESSVFWAPLIPSVKDCGRINSIFVRFLKIYDTSSELSSFVYLTIFCHL